MKIIDESKTTNPDIPLFVDDENLQPSLDDLDTLFSVMLLKNILNFYT